MSKTPPDLRYTEEHEYVKETDDTAVVQVGITDYAQGELGDVVYVDLPKVGATFARMDVFGTIEAVKAGSGLFFPPAGTVTEINAALDSDPAPVNRGTYGEGWRMPRPIKRPQEIDGVLGSGEDKQQNSG